ncbi:MAG: hypothetical protein NDI84_01820 [Steroidobacteraceae bacterium]|nr:hypothetical protein [Steroidobacteraceae bacterium]
MFEASPAVRLPDRDDAEPVPTDGLEVEETRDADTVRMFILEWRRRLRDVSLEASPADGQPERPDGMIDT